jgi:transcriptional regulator with PAS, ATPase and Fis domain
MRERATPGPVRFITADGRTLEILEVVDQIADTDATVLIIGETGTGKELIARMLHAKSSRQRKPLIAVNCGAIAETLQESELFGHAKGAFTGATARKMGSFEAAEGGTIFLDEVSEMTKTLQVKMLRILQSGEYTPVGMTDNRFCNVRVVAATNEDPRPLIDAGDFRKDLYYRLNIIRIELPPLRERRGDVRLLIDHFLAIYDADYAKPDLKMTNEAVEILSRYDFPGNVRELENIVQRAVILCRGQRITAADLPRELSISGVHEETIGTTNFHDIKNRVVEDFERTFLTSILSVCGGIVSRAAERSGLSERNFHAKMRKYGIRGKECRA